MAQKRIGKLKDILKITFIFLRDHIELSNLPTEK